MLLFITKYNLTPKWIQILIFILFYFILIKLHYFDMDNNIADCSRSRFYDMTLAEAEKERIKLANELKNINLSTTEGIKKYADATGNIAELHGVLDYFALIKKIEDTKLEILKQLQLHEQKYNLHNSFIDKKISLLDQDLQKIKIRVDKIFEGLSNKKDIKCEPIIYYEQANVNIERFEYQLHRMQRDVEIIYKHVHDFEKALIEIYNNNHKNVVNNYTYSNDNTEAFDKLNEKFSELKKIIEKQDSVLNELKQKTKETHVALFSNDD